MAELGDFPVRRHNAKISDKGAALKKAVTPEAEEGNENHLGVSMSGFVVLCIPCFGSIETGEIRFPDPCLSKISQQNGLNYSESI